MDADFFSTAAQVIPVLYLVIVFEHRVWDGKQPMTYFGIRTSGPRGDPDGRMAKVVGLLLVLLIGHLVAGEALALAAANGGGGAADRYVVTGALIFGGTIVVLPTLVFGLTALVPRSLWKKRALIDLDVGGWVIEALCVVAVIHTLVAIAVAIF